MSDFNNASKVNSINQFNLKKAISIYLNKWFWFVLSCLICLTAAYFKLRYTAPEYSASAKIMLLDDKESSAAGAAFKDLPLFSEKEEGKVEDEIEVIKSRAILKNVVKDLKLNIQYFSKGRFNDSEIYKNSPITINFIDSDSIIDETNFSFFIKVNSNKNFQYVG